MKANHNLQKIALWQNEAVSNGSKLLKWKQITTYASILISLQRCFQWLKVTKMKANHNVSDTFLLKEGLFPMAQSY